MRYWYDQLLAIPASKDSIAFKRIYRIIADKTRYGLSKGERLHEFYNARHETQLTVSLWENFSLFDTYEWVNELIGLTNKPLNDEVIDCNWSYEWEKRNGARIKLCDVVINYRSKSADGVIIIESKNLGANLGAKDLDAEYYLSIDDFDSFESKSLIYCIDGERIDANRKKISELHDNVGFLSWSSLGDIQVRMIDRLSLNDRIKNLMKASLISQYRSKGITVSNPICEYLSSEPDMHAYVEMPCNGKDMQEKIWTIG